MTISIHSPICIPDELTRLGENLVTRYSKNNTRLGIFGTGREILLENQGYKKLFKNLFLMPWFDDIRLLSEIVLADEVPWHNDSSLLGTVTPITTIVPICLGSFYLHVLKPGNLVKTVSLEYGVPVSFDRSYRHKVTTTSDPEETGKLGSLLVLLAFDNAR